MDYQEKKKIGRNDSSFIDIKAIIRQSLNTDISTLSLEQRKKLAASILKLDLKERKEDEINLLKTLTEDLDFFTKINSKKINQETKLQEKICRRMKYESYQKGQTVIEYGAKADKFFIILSGQVSIFLVKSQEAIDLEEHQLKTGKKLDAWSGNLLNLHDDEELSQKDDINSPLSSVASSNNNRRDSQISVNSPFSSSIRKQSTKMQQLVNSKDSPKMIGSQSEDKNYIQANIDQLGNDESPLQLEKILEKSKFSNYNPPFNKDRYQNHPMLQVKLNFDEKIQELAYEEDFIANYNKNREENDNIVRMNGIQQSRTQSIKQQNELDQENSFQIRQNSLIQKRSVNTLSLQLNTAEMKNSQDNHDQNTFRRSSDISLVHQSHSSPLANTRNISRMTLLQQAIKNNAEGGSQFKKKIKTASIAELRQKLNTLSNSNNTFSPPSSSLSQSNNGSPSKLSSSQQKQLQNGKQIDMFTFTDEDKIQTPKVITSQRNQSKKTRIGKLIDFYKNYDLFGDLQLGEIENAEKYFTDSGIFKYEYRDKMKAGSTFGELGILEGKPRSALIICSEDSEFAIMEKDDYSELLAERDRKNLLKKFEFLKQKMFPELTNDAIRKIFYSFEKRIIQKNEVLFSEGDKANGVFIIKHGEISLSQKQQALQQPNQRDILASDSQLYFTSDSPVLQKRKSLLHKPAKYTSKIFAVISSGEYFGEEDLLLKESKFTRHYKATCSSLEGSVYFIEANTFLKFIKQKPTSQLVIQKRLDKKLKWRTEHKEKQQEQAKKFSQIDSFGLIENTKIKQMMTRRNIPKRSSMIELKTAPSMQLDIPTFSSPSRKSTIIQFKQQSTTSIANTSSNFEGSLTQIPLTGREQLPPQTRLSMNIMTSSVNMDKIQEERSYDGSPKNIYEGQEYLIQEKSLASKQYSNLKLKTENPQRSKNCRQHSKLQHLSSSVIDYTNSPLNTVIENSNENKIMSSNKLQDVELLKKLSSLSKNNQQSVRKLRQTYSNYVNPSSEYRSKVNMFTQTPTHSQVFQQLSQHNSISNVNSCKNWFSNEVIQSPTQSQTLIKRVSIQTSNSNSPIKNANGFQQKLQGFSTAIQNCSNNSINQYSSCFDFNKQMQKFPQILSPEIKKERPSLKELLTLESQKPLIVQKIKDDLKKSDLVKPLSYEYKQFLLKKQNLYESLNIQEQENKKITNPLNVDLFQYKANPKRSISQSDSPQRKLSQQIKKDTNMIRFIMRKVKDKTDPIDSILRTDEFQSFYTIDTKQRENSKHSQDKSKMQDLTDQPNKKQSLNSLVSIVAQNSQDKNFMQELLQEDINQIQIQNRCPQIELSPKKKLISYNLSTKNLPSSKNINFQKIDLYNKLKQSLVQSQSKNFKLQLAQKQNVKNNDSPNNFFVSNYSSLKTFQQVERE